VTVRERLFGVTTAVRVAHGCATPALQPPHDNPGPHITRGSARASPHQVRGCGPVRPDLRTPACRLSPNLARLCVLTSQKRLGHGASKDDSGIRLPLNSKAKQRQDLIDAMGLANPSAANGDAGLHLNDPERGVHECTPEELRRRSTQLLTALYEAKSPKCWVPGPQTFTRLMGRCFGSGSRGRWAGGSSSPNLRADSSPDASTIRQLICLEPIHDAIQ
jgi:hypothetical protein